MTKREASLRSSCNAVKASESDLAAALSRAHASEPSASSPAPDRLIEAASRVFGVAPEKIREEVSRSTLLGRIARDFLGIETVNRKRGRRPIDAESCELVAFVTRECIEQLERGEKQNRRAAFWLYAQQKVPHPSHSDIERFEKRYQRAMKKEFSPLSSLFAAVAPDADKIQS